MAQIKNILSEGSTWTDYNWLHALAVLPFGFFLYIYWWLISKTCGKDLKGLKDLPANAILYTFHRDIHTCVANNCLYTKTDKNLVWLGYHGLASYAFSMPYFLHSPFRSFRYKISKGSHESPLEQIAKFLKKHPADRMVVFTDAGGPYGTVRPTLFQIALKAERPLVAFRQKASSFLTILNHDLPLPFCSIKSEFARPIYPNEIKNLSKKEALILLQNSIALLNSFEKEKTESKKESTDP